MGLENRKKLNNLVDFKAKLKKLVKKLKKLDIKNILNHLMGVID